MKHPRGFYAAVASMTELCAWLRKDNIEIVEMRPAKEEDFVIIDYIYKQEEGS